MSVAIRFDQVSKQYRLRHGWYRSIRDELTHWASRFVSRASGPGDVFWALQDVSFEVEKADIVGLIGRNGAGKSTILKILSRVTAPTSGAFSVVGRLGALIEIGAGFHPDLTGRDNVYLNGAVMGMRRKEIDGKFDSIVAFAELEKFIDTPIKYYSSGMQVRLGFSVAAHVDPDVLLIDEVLSVGDASFQTKCLDKLAELKGQDKTIILVSHNMANIQHHAKKVLWLDEGRVQGYGDPDTVIDQYLRSLRERRPSDVPGQTPHTVTTNGDKPVRIDAVSLCDLQGRSRQVFETGEHACVDISYTIERDVPDPVVEVTLQDSYGYPLGGITTRLDGVKIDTTRDRGTVRLVLRPLLFLKGDYTINVHIRDHKIERYYDFRKRAAVLVVDGPSVASRELSGHLNYPHEWHLL